MLFNIMLIILYVLITTTNTIIYMICIICVYCCWLISDWLWLCHWLCLLPLIELFIFIHYYRYRYLYIIYTHTYIYTNICIYKEKIIQNNTIYIWKLLDIIKHIINIQHSIHSFNNYFNYRIESSNTCVHALIIVSRLKNAWQS